MFRSTLLLIFLFQVAVASANENHIHSDTRDEIVRAIDPWSIGKRNSRAARPYANQVINGLYLGNDEKFAETLNFPCRNYKKEKIDTSNPNQFEVIISLCTYARMVEEMPDLKKMDPKNVDKKFKERGITWIQLGNSLPDDKDAWSDIVFNATFPDSDLTKKDLGIPRKSKKPEHVKFRKNKRLKVEKVSVDKWFEPTFKILDEAVDNGKKTLVHCHAGASRSPALVAAYLIKRYDVTAEQAIAFLRTKRNSSNPKCVKGLKAYAKKLQKLRNEKA